jgi:hypothetical protein
MAILAIPTEIKGLLSFSEKPDNFSDYKPDDSVLYP